MHGLNKYQARESRALVRKLFWEEWDPIGVNHAPEAYGEYNAYADAAYVKLMNENASAADIEAYLVETATGHIGLSYTPRIRECSRIVAEKLAAMKPQFLAQ